MRREWWVRPGELPGEREPERQRESLRYREREPERQREERDAPQTR